MKKFMELHAQIHGIVHGISGSSLRRFTGDSVKIIGFCMEYFMEFVMVFCPPETRFHDKFHELLHGLYLACVAYGGIFSTTETLVHQDGIMS